MLSNLTPSDRVLVEKYLRLTHAGLLRELPLPVDKTVTRLGEQTRLKAAYVPVPFSVRTGEHSPALRGEGDPVAHLINSLTEGERVLIIGEPGMGKSVVMSMAFAQLADAYFAAGDCPLPIHIKLATLDAGADDAEPGGHVVWPPLLRPLSSAARTAMLDRGQVMFLLDGLDELPTFKGGPSNGSIWKRLSATLEYPAAVSCRESYHALKVSGTDFAYLFSEQMELLPLHFADQIDPYTELYCTAMGRPGLAPRIARGLKRNSHLITVLSRPLMMSMTVSVLFIQYAEADGDAGQVEDALDLTGSAFLTAEIYRQFIRRWLVREQRKEQATPSGSQLQWFEKQDILERIAWSIFTNSKSLRSGYGSFRLADLIIPARRADAITESWLRDHPGPTSVDAREACREISERTFLISSNGETGLQFAHKSFFEFILAQHVYNSLSREIGDDEVAALLFIPLPDEVIDFLREILHWSASGRDRADRLSNVRSNLLNAIRRLPQTTATLMSRQQAANLVPIVAEPASRQTIRQVARDQHAFIFRAIAVGEALHHDDSSMLDEFLQRMDVDPIAASYHMGYNRIYYSDQALTSESFRDDGGSICGSFIKNCIRHLTMQPRADGSIPYFSIRSQALASVRLMLEDPVRAHRLTREDRPSLEDLQRLCDEPDHAQSSEYERQRQELKPLLNRVLGLRT